MLSDAIRGVVNFGWQINWGTCKSIAVLDDKQGIVATGELVFR